MVISCHDHLLDRALARLCLSSIRGDWNLTQNRWTERLTKTHGVVIEAHDGIRLPLQIHKKSSQQSSSKVSQQHYSRPYSYTTILLQQYIDRTSASIYLQLENMIMTAESGISTEPWVWGTIMYNIHRKRSYALFTNKQHSCPLTRKNKWQVSAGARWKQFPNNQIMTQLFLLFTSQGVSVHITCCGGHVIATISGLHMYTYGQGTGCK